MLFFDKELSKAIMTRTKLRNNFQQTKKEENVKSFMHNKESFVSLLRKIKKNHLSQICH